MPNKFIKSHYCPNFMTEKTMNEKKNRYSLSSNLPQVTPVTNRYLNLSLPDSKDCALNYDIWFPHRGDQSLKIWNIF